MYKALNDVLALPGSLAVSGLIVRHTKRHKCGLKSVCLRHPLKLVGFADAAFKAQPDEPIGLALRGLAATLQEDSPTNG